MSWLTYRLRLNSANRKKLIEPRVGRGAFTRSFWNLRVSNWSLPLRKPNRSRVLINRTVWSWLSCLGWRNWRGLGAFGRMCLSSISKFFSLCFKYLNRKSKVKLTVPSYERKSKRLVNSFHEMTAFFEDLQK